MKSRILAWIAASTLAPAAAIADDLIPPAAYKQVLGDHVFVMLPGHTQLDTRRWIVTETLPSESGQPYRVSGLYRNDGSVTPLWTVGWYAGRTHLTRDGRFLVRVEPLLGDYEDLAVAFYDRGQLLEEHRVSDLVQRPDELPRSVSHFRWLQSAELDDAATFRLRTLTGERHTFDLAGLAPLMAQVVLTAPPEVSIGEPFSLAAGERMAIPDADVLVELERLSYRRCPAGAVCIAPDGPVVEFRVVELSSGTELHRGASRRTPPDRFPYFVLQMDSDGETYARFSVHGSVAWCESRSSRADEQLCWSQLARATRDAAYCRRIAALGRPADECYRRVSVGRP